MSFGKQQKRFLKAANNIFGIRLHESIKISGVIHPTYSSSLSEGTQDNSWQI